MHEWRSLRLQLCNVQYVFISIRYLHTVDHFVLTYTFNRCLKYL